MIKKLLLPLFLIGIGSVVYSLVTATMERISYFYEEVTRRDDQYPFLNNSLRQLRPEEINKLAIKYKIELAQLDSLQSNTIALLALCGIVVIAIIGFKPDFSVKKFDGVTVMASYTLLICATFSVFKLFIDSRFEDASNASIGIRASIEIILMIITPLVFFAALKLNKFEISKNLHHAKWISQLAIVVTVLSGLIALVIGIGVLSTPGVSSFTN